MKSRFFVHKCWVTGFRIEYKYNNRPESVLSFDYIVEGQMYPSTYLYGTFDPTQKYIKTLFGSFELDDLLKGGSKVMALRRFAVLDNLGGSWR